MLCQNTKMLQTCSHVVVLAVSSTINQVVHVVARLATGQARIEKLGLERSGCKSGSGVGRCRAPALSPTITCPFVHCMGVMGHRTQKNEGIEDRHTSRDVRRQEQQLARAARKIKRGTWSTSQERREEGTLSVRSGSVPTAARNHLSLSGESRVLAPSKISSRATHSLW